jgi:hypothetical protein
MTYDEIEAGGIRSHGDLGMVMSGESEARPPEPITRYASVPGRPDGRVDLTEALTGDVSYGPREFDLKFAIPVSEENMQSLRTRVMDAWHGRRLEFRCSWDPGYTYAGRFSVESLRQAGPDHMTMELKIEADAFRVRDGTTYRLNAVGGRLYQFPCGRVPCHPTIDCTAPTIVVSGGRATVLGAGSWRLNDVLFRQGVNELWIDTYQVRTVRWSDLREGGERQATWGSVSRMRWAELCSIGWSGGDTAPVRRSWSDLGGETWGSLAESRWRDLDTRDGVVDAVVVIRYEWRDL